MKTLIALTTLIAGSIHATEITDSLLQSIAEIESGNDNRKVGKKKETTAWQLTDAARWDVLKFRRSRKDSADYIAKVWSKAREDAYYIAADYIMVINIECNQHLGRWPTLAEVLWCYNWGVQNVKEVNFQFARIPYSVAAYADRVVNRMNRK